MICAKCQGSNPDSNRFCEHCGATLERRCPQCGEAISPTAQFCGACGHGLSQDAAQSEPTPEEPTPAPTGERRQATVLFSDLSGFTAMTEKLDPEEVQGLMRRLKDRAVEIVEAHGGIVSQFVGDEVLALFGIPTAHEDDPVRAVRAAQGLHELARELSPEVEEKIGRGLRMHTGIDSGLVVTSTADVRDGTVGVTGDTVNTGARLKALAEDDTILISPETKRRVADYFETEALDAAEFKGKAEAVTPYRITGETAVRTSFQAAERRGFTPYAGREEELAQFHRCLDRTMAGEGQFVTVVGEAGIGKSRLLYEFRHSIDRDKTTILEGRCHSYGANTAYLPLLDALRRGLLLLDEDTPADLLEKAVSNIRAIDAGLEEYIPLYLHLLSIPNEEFPVPKRLQGQELQSALRDALAAINVAGARRKPMVVIYEDWHWADEASDMALRHLVGAMASQPLMVVVIYRPEYQGQWSNLSHHTPLVIKPLDTSAGEEIVKGVWRVERLPGGLAPVIQEHTGGNPFFIEEMCNALTEEGTVRVHDGEATLNRPLERLTLPDTVQAVIRARLDRLVREDQETLRLASVIGREFARRILERISAAAARLAPSLEVLKNLELIRQIRFLPETAYMFNHVLTQEVTYETLLLQKRRELHGLVGRAIEELYAERINEQVELLAHHFSLAEDWEKAVRYGQLAAEKAYNLSQFLEAVRLYEQAIEWLGKLPEDRTRQETMVDLQVALSWCYSPLGRFDDQERICLQAEPAAKSLADRARTGKIFGSLSFSYMIRGQFEKSERTVLTAIENLEHTDEVWVLTWFIQMLGSLYLSQGLWRKSEPLLVRAFRNWEKLNLQKAYLLGANVQSYSAICAQLGYNVGVLGRPSEGRAYIEKGQAPEQEAIVNLQSKSMIMSWHGLYVALNGVDGLGAMDRADRLVHIAEQSDSPFQMLTAYLTKTNILAGLEEFEEVRNFGGKALKAIEGKNIRTGHVANLNYNLALAHIVLGDHETAERHYDDGLPLVEISPHWWGPRYKFLQGLLVGAKEEFAQAEELFHRSARDDEEVGGLVTAAQTRYHLGLMLGRKGEVERARELVTQLEKQFREWGVPVWEGKCRQALAELPQP